jgi:hypothetical protein
VRMIHLTYVGCKGPRYQHRKQRICPPALMLFVISMQVTMRGADDE